MAANNHQPKLSLSFATVSTKRSCRRKFAQLMPHHLLGHKDLDVVFPVVNHERVANKLGHDRAGPYPRLNWILGTRRIQLFHFHVKLGIDVRTFFC